MTFCGSIYLTLLALSMHILLPWQDAGAVSLNAGHAEIITLAQTKQWLCWKGMPICSRGFEFDGLPPL